LDAITQALACARVDASPNIEVAADGDQLAAARRSTTAAKILAAEDNDIGQEVLRQVLTQAGYDFEIVATGRQAVEAWRRGGFSLILMDCQMPDMDGFEATREIRRCEQDMVRTSSAPPRIPIVALTANALKGDREKCLAAGMDDHAPKPFEPSRLIDVIETHIAETEKKRMDTVDKQPNDAECDAPATGAESHGADLVVPPSFDLDAVLKRWGGDRGFVQKLIDKFLAQAPPELEQLARCVAGGDITETTRLAHGLKGAAGYCGADPFREVAARLEAIGRGGSLDGADACVEELRAKLDRCRVEAGDGIAAHDDSASMTQA